jgi:predicted SnoaL-like aldol condensation-catalyzing enzyme
MSQLLKTVQVIYDAMEQGNMGKIMSVFDENFKVHLAGSLGGVYKGREGILEVISKMCSSSSSSKKVIENIIEINNQVVVLGKINFYDSDDIIAEMPFVDVWKSNENKIVEVQLFYLDAALLNEYLKL